MIAISLSTATTAVSRKIRDSLENDHGGDRGAETRPGFDRELAKLAFPIRILPVQRHASSRSDSALLLMLVSYALSIIRRTAAHYADVSHGGRVANEEDSPRTMCFFFLFFCLL